MATGRGWTAEGGWGPLALMDRQIEPVSDVVPCLLRPLTPWFRPCGMLRRRSWTVCACQPARSLSDVVYIAQGHLIKHGPGLA